MDFGHRLVGCVNRAPSLHKGGSGVIARVELQISTDYVRKVQRLNKNARMI